MKKSFLLLSLALTTLLCGAQKPYGPTPTQAQLEWQKMEMNMFCHFGPNTFTGKEWGDGTEIEDIFNPTSLDCNQWAAVAKAAGFKGIIITAKHHDGFCLWPNPVSAHTVKQSVWRNGQGDVLRELSDACHQADLNFGVYISPWDRNAPTYGSPAYNQTFLATLQSALTQYGPVYEQWFDGANGEGPNGKRQVYDWKAFNKAVHKMQPNAVIFSDVGPGCRWMGNEQGVCGQTCWSRLNTKGYAPGADAPSQDTLNRGNYNGQQWIPAETDVSIRPGWFYRDSEHPKSVQELLQIYYTSVGRNSLLLLNVPPDTRGLIATEDSIRLMELRTALDSIFAHDLAQNTNKITASSVRNLSKKKFDNDWHCDWFAKGQRFYASEFGGSMMLEDEYDRYWSAEDGVTQADVTFIFEEPQTFNRIVLQEYIPLGQRIEEFHIDILEADGTWKTVASETTIGYKRILCVETCTTKEVRLVIDDARACPILNRFGLYMDRILAN